jgi:hypothetical protein
MGISGGPDLIQDGLVLCLDASDKNSYPGSGTTWYDMSGNNNHFSLINGISYSNGYMSFDGTNDYAISINSINLSSYSSVTVEAIFKTPTDSTQGMIYEHTPNWNTYAGGFGLYINSNGNTLATHLHHTNHNTEGARNYVLSGSSNWNCHTNIHSKVSDSTGRLVYGNASLLSFSTTGGYGIGTDTSAGSFANDYLYIGARAGTGAYFTGYISLLRIYGTKMTNTQISQNYNAQKSRFGL